ncbi:MULTISPECIES: hypothetical protein [Streptomyces]|nr:MULTISPECIES: hypothetical protein [Streptomyces]
MTDRLVIPGWRCDGLLAGSAAPCARVLHAPAAWRGESVRW